MVFTFQTPVDDGCAVEVGGGFADLDVVDGCHAACFFGGRVRRLGNFLHDEQQQPVELKIAR